MGIIVVSLPCTEYLCGSLIVLCKRPNKYINTALPEPYHLFRQGHVLTISKSAAKADGSTYHINGFKGEAARLPGAKLPSHRLRSFSWCSF